MDIIQARNLVVGYDGTVVLEDVSFGVPAGRITFVVGESGAGKTSLLKTMIGLTPPLGGEIVLNGQPIDYRSERSLRDLYRRIGVLFQTGALLNSLTLYDNVALPIRISCPGTPRAEEARLVETILGRVGLAGAGPKYPYELSGGMRKRGALARAMVLEPEMVFCDEPSSGLDPLTAAGLDDLIVRLRDDHGMTFIVVSHELRSIRRIADRIIVLNEGKILFDGDRTELETTGDPYLRRFFIKDGRP